MKIFKSKPAKDNKRPDSTRRSFIWKLGAGMSAVAAAAVPGVAGAGLKNESGLKNRVADLSKEIARLESEKAVLRLQQRYENLLDEGNFEEVPELFTDDGEVIFNGGVFKGKNSGISRLYCHRFKTFSTGRRMEQAPGFELDFEDDMVNISPDGKSASACFSYSMRVGAPVSSDSILVKMARLQGEGIMKWWEGGIYEVSCIKNAKDNGWKIKKLEYHTLSKADYKTGKSAAGPISVPLFSALYPDDPEGPDMLAV